ncbi:hypothetical protein [Amphibacillus cookii]|uniref:hypothetical protein n=1 Tax=Amphibacillus cookii TaxID=767787 RepID=UPI00195C38D8|nr:hypothetical protein [Amphibacillus cookii]MBM7541578.1 hypothetical protein [Amphibacillus cookii]
MISSVSNSYDVTKDPRFLAFNRLATENYGGDKVADEDRYSISFSEFCEKLEKGEIVEPKNTANIANRYVEANWDFRVENTFEKINPELGNKVLEIIRKSYQLGMVNEDNMLLRNKAIYAYTHSV